MASGADETDDTRTPAEWLRTGISVGSLRAERDAAKHQCDAIGGGLTKKQFCDEHIKTRAYIPAEKRSVAYYELLSGQTDSEGVAAVAKANLFVSHPWGSDISSDKGMGVVEFFDTVLGYGADNIYPCLHPTLLNPAATV